MPLAPGQTVLFIGDSITHAHRRPADFHDCYQLGCGYVNSVAAELTAAHPAAGWRFLNRGKCGDTVQRLSGRWAADCLAERPAIISVLIGINDAHSADVRPDRFGADYRRLLDLTPTTLPDARFVLLEPFGLRVDPHPQVDVISPGQLDRLAALRRVVREVASAAGAVFVPLQDAFDREAGPPSAWTLDGIHPSAAGHWLVARAWVAAARRAGWFPDERGDT